MTQHSTLRLAPNLVLPLNVVTRKLAFLGTTGSGKTYGATKLAELMIQAGAQIVALDPVGMWWSLRLAEDGASPGISIPVFGGLHGDLPLEPTAGALIADIICDRGISAVLDISQFEYDTDRVRFSTDFGRRLFFRKKSAPSAIHLFYEEAQNFLPQNTQRGEERMLHNFVRMDKEGRNFGIGRSIISQRPQEISKRALNLTELVLAFQTNGTHERKSIADWVKEQGEDVDVVALLPKLKTGHAHAWSPSWLEMSDTVHVAKKWTYDASATPEVGEVAVEARALAPIDLEKLAVDMAATIEHAKENDPDELKKRIKELELQVKRGAAASPPVVRDVVDHDAVRREVDLATRAMQKTFEDQKADFANMVLAELPTIDEVVRQLTERRAALGDIAVRTKMAGVPMPRYTPPPRREFSSEQDRRVNGNNVVVTPVSNTPATNGNQSAEQKILNALAALAQLGFPTPKKSNVAFFAGYVENWRFDGRIADLREKGLIEVVGPGELALTRDGRAIADATQSIRTLGELHSKWLEKLPDAESQALRILLSAHPGRVSRQGLASEMDRQDNWRFAAVLNQLKTLGIAEIEGNAIALTDALFPAGLT